MKLYWSYIAAADACPVPGELKYGCGIQKNPCTNGEFCSPLEATSDCWYPVGNIP